MEGENVHASNAMLRVKPSNLTISVTETFTVAVYVENIVDLYGWEFMLFYQKHKLNVTLCEYGPFLQSGGTTFEVDKTNSEYNTTHGLVWLGQSLLGAPTGVNGNGTLASITLKAENEGWTLLALRNTKLSDVSANSIPHTTSDAEVRNVVSSSHRVIDLYTQKEPYSGKGPNQPSDAFSPDDNVILYAYITYNDAPVLGRNVAFDIQGPVNSVENLTYGRTAKTNMYGVTNVSVRMPWLDGYAEEAIFGVWNVIATVRIAEVAVNDTLAFKVGWVVELIEVETVDINNVSQTVFVRDENVRLRLTVRNIAMTDKIVTLSLSVHDCLNFSLGQILFEEKRVLPSATTYFISDLLIPKWAFLGSGIVYANAYTALPRLGGVPWCPQVSTTFSIVERTPDVAVISITPTANEVFPSQEVNIIVVVGNDGDISQTFNVSCYYNSTSIGTWIVKNLPPQTQQTLTFRWYSCFIPPGNYTISAEASTVPNEINTDNNRLTDGIIQIKQETPTPPIEHELSRSLLAALFLLAVLAGVCLVVLVGLAFWCKRERKKDGETKQLTASPAKPRKVSSFKTTETCSACGREFPGVYTFCPYCLTFHGKDY